MKTLLFCVALLAAGAASADELADADALFAKKSYPEALQKYTRLANAGNPVAQQHLGEMYFYGEAGAVDMDKAALWFRKAAAKGNATAIASLDMMKQRNTTARISAPTNTAARRRASRPSRARTKRSSAMAPR
jgi:TPR repeat protein